MVLRRVNDAQLRKALFEILPVAVDPMDLSIIFGTCHQKRSSMLRV